MCWSLFVLRTSLRSWQRHTGSHFLAVRIDGCPYARVEDQVLRGERSVTAETAVRLGRYLGTGPAFWMNL